MAEQQNPNWRQRAADRHAAEKTAIQDALSTTGFRVVIGLIVVAVVVFALAGTFF